MNWRDISRNPVDPKVHGFMLSHLKSKRLITRDLLKFLEEFVTNKNVLDIGVVEHDISHIESENWKHKKLAHWSKRLVGVDILSKEIEHLNRIGYDVRLVDATSNVDIGERFERIVIGDVIEHVSNPVQLLEFASRHLSSDGLIMVSTPNPFCYAFILRLIKEGTFIANAEHVSWITPTMAVELASRAKVSLINYYAVVGAPRSILKRIIKRAIRLLLPEDCEIYAGAYIYIFSK